MRQTVARQTVASPIKEFETNSWATNRSTIENTAGSLLEDKDKRGGTIPMKERGRPIKGFGEFEETFKEECVGKPGIEVRAGKPAWGSSCGLTFMPFRRANYPHAECTSTCAMIMPRGKPSHSFSEFPAHGETRSAWLSLIRKEARHKNVEGRKHKCNSLIMLHFQYLIASVNIVDNMIWHFGGAIMAIRGAETLGHIRLNFPITFSLIASVGLLALTFWYWYEAQSVKDTLVFFLAGAAAVGQVTASFYMARALAESLHKDERDIARAEEIDAREAARDATRLRQTEEIDAREAARGFTRLKQASVGFGQRWNDPTMYQMA